MGATLTLPLILAGFAGACGLIEPSWSIAPSDPFALARRLSQRFGGAYIVMDASEDARGAQIKAGQVDGAAKEFAAKTGYALTPKGGAAWPVGYPGYHYSLKSQQLTGVSEPYASRYPLASEKQFSVKEGQVIVAPPTQGMHLTAQQVVAAKWSRPLAVEPFLMRSRVVVFGPPVKEADWIESFALAIGADLKVTKEQYTLTTNVEQYRTRAVGFWKRRANKIRPTARPGSFNEYLLLKSEFAASAIQHTSARTLTEVVKRSLSDPRHLYGDRFSPGHPVFAAAMRVYEFKLKQGSALGVLSRISPTKPVIATIMGDGEVTTTFQNEAGDVHIDL